MGRIKDKLRQNVSGDIPPWQKVIDVAQDVGAAAETFTDVYSFGLKPLAREADAKLMSAITGKDVQPRETIKPATEFGETLQTGAGIIGGFKSPVWKALGSLPKLLETRKVSKIQKAFFPWVKKHQAEFGKVLRGGIKEMSRGGKKEEAVKKGKNIFKVLTKKEGYKELPPNVRTSVDSVVSSEKPSLSQMIKAYNKVRKSVKTAEFEGKGFSEAGMIAKESTRSLRKVGEKFIPGLKEESARFAEHAKVRGTISRLFQPKEVGLGSLGTARGTKALRGIRGLQPAEQEAIGQFGKETGINIVGPAKVASLARSSGKTVAKLGTIGATLWLLNRLWPRGAKPISNVMDVSQ